MHQQQRIARHLTAALFRAGDDGCWSDGDQIAEKSWVRSCLIRKVNDDDADGVFVVGGDFVTESGGKEKERATNWSGSLICEGEGEGGEESELGN